MDFLLLAQRQRGGCGWNLNQSASLRITSSMGADPSARPVAVLAWLASAGTFWALPLDDNDVSDGGDATPGGSCEAPVRASCVHDTRLAQWGLAEGFKTQEMH